MMIESHAPASKHRAPSIAALRIGAKWLVGMTIVSTLSGCATRFESSDDGTGGAFAQKNLAFQNMALTPKNGGRLMLPEELRDGDIILTADNGITSTGIRLLTLAPVSHAALYLGDAQIGEAVGAGIRVRKVDDLLKDEAVIVAFRHPQLTPAQAARIREFAQNHVGESYNHVGVVLQAPFSLERRVCELPLVPEAVRDFCVRGVAAIQLGAGSNDRFFCSQFVLQAYRFAGLPITDADPRLISPVDILHMREGDVPSVKIKQSLLYVGHLKYKAADAVAATRMSSSRALQ